MSERAYILSNLDYVGKATFLATENWTVEDWRQIRDLDYYSLKSRIGSNSIEFREYKLNRILGR